MDEAFRELITDFDLSTDDTQLMEFQRRSSLKSHLRTENNSAISNKKDQLSNQDNKQR